MRSSVRRPQVQHTLILFSAICLLSAALSGCEEQRTTSKAVVSTKQDSTSDKQSESAPSAKPLSSAANKQFAGSKTCYDCHTKFYDLWATSRHGLAMQAYSDAFAKKELQPQKKDVVIGKQSFRAEI